MNALSAGEVRTAVGREWGRFTALLGSLDGDAAGWSRPTRLPGWTVADLAAHAVWGVSMEADALRRARTGAPGTAEGRVADPSSGPGVVLGRLVEAVEALLAELDQVAGDDAERSLPLPYGDVPMALALSIFTMEAGVHADDLAAALGGEGSLAPDVCAATVPVLRVFLPILAAGATEKPAEHTAVVLQGPTVRLALRFAGGTWEAADAAEPTATVTGRDDSTILLYALGRTRPGDPRLTVSGSAEVLDAFKRWCPGP